MFALVVYEDESDEEWWRRAGCESRRASRCVFSRRCLGQAESNCAFWGRALQYVDGRAQEYMYCLPSQPQL